MATNCAYLPGYVETTKDQVATPAPWDDKARAYVVTGPCPRCGHTTSADVIPAAVPLPEVAPAAAVAQGEEEDKKAKAPAARPFMRVCDCDYLHLDRDKKPGQGCGARWALTVSGTDPGTVDPVTGSPPLTTADQAAVDGAIDGALAQARGTAEKWRNVLAGLSGLVGTFLVLAGVTEFAKAPRAELVVALGLLGLGCAVLGMYFAAQAAIGDRVEYPTKGAGDAAGMKLARILQARYAHDHLGAAKVLTVAAGFFLVLATLFTYVAAQDDAAPQLSLKLRNEGDEPSGGGNARVEVDVARPDECAAAAPRSRVTLPVSAIPVIRPSLGYGPST